MKWITSTAIKETGFSGEFYLVFKEETYQFYKLFQKVDVKGTSPKIFWGQYYLDNKNLSTIPEEKNKDQYMIVVITLHSSVTPK